MEKISPCEEVEPEYPFVAGDYAASHKAAQAAAERVIRRKARPTPKMRVGA